MADQRVADLSNRHGEGSPAGWQKNRDSLIHRLQAVLN
ncbi:hypothetical protein ppKF707_0105 [Metapseudomonas furukawaii]|uniref:Uncharacterized protein n=1 Tax=Metapseudomonas furukawaii TaxID=1149133 RepID=A0AAD1FHQ2_METFU|nr:hypothetical protein ppKF707_0105 [Pseudomonas furukawaii]BAU76467.1 hypothetical protein KF707C_47790 [Pseudomonas furukawaii]